MYGTEYVQSLQKYLKKTEVIDIMNHKLIYNYFISLKA